MTTNNGQHPLANKELDVTFKALSHPTRRTIVRSLPVERPCNVAAIAAEASGADNPAQIDADLHHVHLPFLDDAGVLDWDTDTNTITPGHRYHTARQILQRLEATAQSSCD